MYAALDLTAAEGAQPGLFPIEEVHQPSAEIARALYVFAAAAVDVTIKRLLQDCMIPILGKSAAARTARDRYLDEKVGVEQLRKLAKNQDPAAARDKNYLAHLSKGSMQQSGRMIQVLAALGLERPTPSKVRTTVDPFITARNEIVHDLDIEADGNGTRRRSRYAADAIEQADALFGILLDMIEATSALLLTPDTPPSS
jgi:hypothetical protein